MKRTDENEGGAGEVESAASVPKRRSWRGIVVGSVFALVMLTGAGVLVGIVLSRSSPAWWAEVDARDAGVEAAARRVENGATTQLSMVREMRAGSDGAAGGSEPWTIAVKQEDANAWLAARLPGWLESQAEEQGGWGGRGGKPFRWPKDVGQVQVRFEEGAVRVAARVKMKGKNGNGEERVLGALLRPELREGALWIPARRVTVGRLSVPASWVLAEKGAERGAGAGGAAGVGGVSETLRALPQATSLMAVFAGDAPALKKPVIKIGDGRRVELVGVESREGVVLMTLRTIGREERKAQRE